MEFLIILGGWVIVFGAAFIISTVLIRRRYQGPANWPATMGEITRAYIYRHERRTPTAVEVTYTPVITYTYTVAGQTYTGQRRTFEPDDQVSYRAERVARGLIAGAPEGTWVKVYYNPRVPQQAVLVPQRPVAHNAVLWYGVANVLVGALAIVLAFVIPW